MAKTTFSLLHLTDLHFGMDEENWLWPNFREAFYEDLARLHKLCGPWDLVLFTGDLTMTGSLKQFNAMNALLHDLWKHLATLGSKPALLTIPGNHDLLRPDPDKPEVIALGEYSKRSSIRDGLWKKSKSPYRTLIQKMFRSYSEWSQRHSLPRPVGVTHGALPGDFACTIEKQGARLGVLGLNSAFLQLTGEDYEGKLAIHPSQFHAACKPDGAAWARQHHACILVTHHPPAWLEPEALAVLEGEIAVPGRFAVHLFGHLHQAQIQTVSRGASAARRVWQGCSLFGLEYLDDDRRVQRKHGYAAVQITFQGDKGTIRLWPREAYLQQSNARRLVPDPSIQLLDDQGTRPEEFSLLIPYEAAATGLIVPVDVYQKTAEILKPGDLMIKYQHMLEQTWTTILEPEVRKYCADMSQNINSGNLLSRIDDSFFLGLEDLFLRLYTCMQQLELQRNMFKDYASPTSDKSNLFEWEQAQEYGELDYREAVKAGVRAFREHYYGAGVQGPIEKDPGGFLKVFMFNIKGFVFSRNSDYSRAIFLKYQQDYYANHPPSGSPGQTDQPLHADAPVKKESSRKKRDV